MFVLIFALFIFPGSYTLAQEHSEEHDSHSSEFDPSTFILDHIADSHEWHIYTDRHGHHVSIYLPVIVYTKEKGINIFFSKHLAHGHVYKGFRIMEEGDHKGKIVEVDEEGLIIEGKLPLDFSITKNITAMIFAAFLLLWLFISLAVSYKRTGISAPKGIQGFLEPIVLFVRDDIAIPNIGEHKYGKYMPYLLTAFFFILINNLLGLVPILPGGANVTGNIAVTLVLALFTFFITQFSGNKQYWGHIFNTPGVPLWLKPIMIPVELIGIISKPFALMVRLFANITAGHIIVLSLVSLIFIFKSLAVAPVSILFVLFMDLLELLVAFLQAYVFTLLSALFIGLAVQEHH
ncbi:MAG: F0F1 ATP synthase subunit A [Bacteroidales bacterium]|nr:F0F1 ATP synthase subunit A [Bacteroidales bacterium]